MNKPHIVIDTNILISAILFKGKPGQIVDLVVAESIKASTSPILLSELTEVLTKKFLLSQDELDQAEYTITSSFNFVDPKIILTIVNDDDDNRVLEAAVEGKCSYIITGDKQLLELVSFQGIKILTANQFLTEIKED